jgi:uncharacterized membrane protein YuzA (DUF378 family)
MTRLHRTSATTLIAALLTGLAGFMAFNVVDAVFGVPSALVGLAVWIALTTFVFRRPTPAEEEHDA